MNTDKIESLLEAGLALVESGSASGETLGALANDLYSELTDKYRPLLEALPHVADNVGNDLALIVNTFFANRNQYS